MRFAFLALLATTACGRPYEPGSFEGLRVTFAGGRGSAGCLDLAVDVAYETCPADVECPEAPVATISLGNRCRHPIPIDVAQIVFVSRPGERRLRIADPKQELHKAELDGRAMASERFELIGGSPEQDVTMVCANPGRITEPEWQGPVLCAAVAPKPAAPKPAAPPPSEDQPPPVGNGQAIIAEASL